MADEVGARRWNCGLCGRDFGSREETANHLRNIHLRDASRNAQLICVRATTLPRNRHYLFDTESPPEQQRHQALVLPLPPGGSSVRFVRTGSEVRPQLSWGRQPSSPSVASPLHTQLAYRNLGHGPVVERTPTSADTQIASRRKMWFSVDKSGHVLKEGELIKMGSFMITVKQVVLEGEEQLPMYSCAKDVGTSPVRQMRSLQRSNTAHCRICLSGPGRVLDECPPAEADAADDDDDEGPLILAPCLCRGSVQRVHLSCLQQWLGMRYSADDKSSVEGAVILSFKPPGCEICKTEFPAVWQPAEGMERVSLLPGLAAVKPPFVVLSTSTQRGSDGENKDRPHGERCVFAPGDTGAELRIGRQRGVELRQNDQSVSRVHARIRFADGQFLLEDNNSRFKTLVLPTGPRELQASQSGLSVQAGRTLLSFALMENEASDEALASHAFRRSDTLPLLQHGLAEAMADLPADADVPSGDEGDELSGGERLSEAVPAAAQ